MLIKEPLTVCIMITPRRILLLIFMLTLIVNGAYKYIGKGIYHDYSQWDLRSHTAATQWALSGSPAPAAGAPQTYLPPYLPVAFPLLDLAGRFDWAIVKIAWLLLLGGFLALLFGTLLEELHQAAPLSARRAWLMSGAFWLFPATFLGLAAGQMSLAVIFLLFCFWQIRNRYPLLAAFCLALGSLKLSLALPFFLFLLLTAQYRLFFLSTGLTILLNGLVSLLYLGPAGHLAHLFEATILLASLGVNNPALMGESGRIDLAPLAALFGIHGWGWALLATGIVLGGLIWLFRRREMDPRLLLFNLNLLIFLVLYHRAYDLVLLLWLGLPLLWRRLPELKAAEIFFLLPLVLPLQWLFNTGMNYFQVAAPLWHLIGSSSAIALLTLAVCANRLRQNS